MLWKSFLTVLSSVFFGGCMYASIPNYASYYYDSWFGEFHSEIKYARADEVYQFSIGYENPASGELSKFKLPKDQVPVFPDFIQMNIGGISLKLNELTPELAVEFSYSGPHKSGFIEYGDAVSYMAKGLNVTFCDGCPVYLHCMATNIVFRNTQTGKSGKLPMSIRKMKSIFGEPSRKKKDIVL